MALRALFRRGVMMSFAGEVRLYRIAIDHTNPLEKRKIGGTLFSEECPAHPPPRKFYQAPASAFPQRKCRCRRVLKVLEVGFGEDLLTRGSVPISRM